MEGVGGVPLTGFFGPLQFYDGLEHPMTGEIGLLDQVEREGAEFTISINESGYRFIFCHLCRKRSYHPMDIEHKYCGFCHVWLEDLRV